ncbi:hypothetical protein RFI_06499 [Reticulomyxa filosa]|uniref:Cation/H+ exchanger transmembrane domain-containing protein n=1 Tax=Reticulomyxa filosa TaxID=46433 RepID=X6NX80_RETFI|nr:hypothetical protein RFI_06499 [Reticulomyxa filosa]|eukprot:ETO30621.1 hypothetical protein RFI_06499 [Reticulomyxa filosa]
MPNLSFTDNMMLGSLISAVDPVAVLVVLKTLSVDEQLKVILFGESVVNDAAAVVINRVFVGISDNPRSAKEAFGLATPDIIGIAVGSSLIGTVCAFFFARIFKVSNLRKVPEIEIGVFLLAAFIPYAIADICHLSGIMSVLFAGIMTDYYTYHHLSKHARHTTKQIISVLANLAESFVFVYLGMAFFLEKHHDFRPGYCFLTLVCHYFNHVQFNTIQINK